MPDGFGMNRFRGGARDFFSNKHDLNIAIVSSTRKHRVERWTMPHLNNPRVR